MVGDVEVAEEKAAIEDAEAAIAERFDEVDYDVGNTVEEVGEDVFGEGVEPSGTRITFAYGDLVYGYKTEGMVSSM